MKISVKIVQAVKEQNHAKTYFRDACSRKRCGEPERFCNFVRLIREDDDLPGGHYHLHFLRDFVLLLHKISAIR
jgi:hypothetical protein